MNILKSTYIYIYIYIYICFDGEDSFVNLRFNYNGDEYLFVEFVPKNNRLVDAFKRVLKLKEKKQCIVFISLYDYWSV